MSEEDVLFASSVHYELENYRIVSKLFWPNVHNGIPISDHFAGIIMEIVEVPRGAHTGVGIRYPVTEDHLGNKMYNTPILLVRDFSSKTVILNTLRRTSPIMYNKLLEDNYELFIDTAKTTEHRRVRVLTGINYKEILEKKNCWEIKYREDYQETVAGLLNETSSLLQPVTSINRRLALLNPQLQKHRIYK